MFTPITSTIQTISVHFKEGSKSSILRGKIEFITIDKNFIGGYLSTRFFVEDDLVDFAGENDKEGFFIVGVHGKSVVSGLTGGEFFELLENRYGEKTVSFVLTQDIEAISGCE